MPVIEFHFHGKEDLRKWETEHAGEINVVYEMIDLQPRTFGELRHLFGEGSPLRATGVLSNCLEVLQTRGAILSTDFPTAQQTKYFVASTVGERIASKMSLWKRGVGDVFRQKVFRREVAEAGSAEVSQSYERNSFSAFFGNCTLARKGSGFEVEEYRDWEFVRAKGARGTVKDVELQVEVLNARFPNYNSENDQLKIRGSFKRPLGRAQRIPETAQRRYVAKFFNCLQEVGERTQVLTMQANGLLYNFRGDKSEALKALQAFESGSGDAYAHELLQLRAYLKEKFPPQLKGSADRKSEAVQYAKGYLERLRI